MKLESQPVESSRGGGAGGVARLIAMLGVLASAIVGVLIVVDVLPRDVLGEFALKLIGVGAIALLASTAIALLAKR